MVTRTDSPSSQSGTATPVPGAEGYLLLTIPNAVVNQIFEGEAMPLARGEMKVECISLPIPAAIGKQTANPFAPSPNDPVVPTHDFWLVLKVGDFEMPLVPDTAIGASNSNDGVSYTIPSPQIPNASVRFVLPKPKSAAEMDDLDSFETLLRQYRSLGAEVTALTDLTVPTFGNADSVKGSSPPLAPTEMRGKVVLVNEETGELLGELDQSVDIEEDAKVASQDKNRPVVLDFGNVVEGYAPKVKVQRIREEDMDDWMLRGAHKISQGILSFSSWSQKIINSGADMVIRNTTPRQEPVKFHPAAKATVRYTHNATVKTVNVTKTTVGMINNAIMKVVERAYDTGVKPLYEPLEDDEKPPLPPRTGATAGAPAASPARPGVTKIDIPNEKAGLHASDNKPPTYSQATNEKPTQSPLASSGQASPQSPSSPSAAAGGSKTKRPLLNRLFLAGEVVLSSLEATANDLIVTGTAAASNAAGHKFGPDAGQATALLGGSVRNVAVVYVDVRGVGRRALLKGTAKGFVKARLRNGEAVRLQAEGKERGGVQVDEGEVESGKDGEAVIGMAEVARRQSLGPEPACRGRLSLNFV